MAVFFDTGGGDIYAGPTKEAVIAEMLADSEDVDVSQIEEVSGDLQILNADEELVTLEQDYADGLTKGHLGSYCIASENC